MQMWMWYLCMGVIRGVNMLLEEMRQKKKRCGSPKKEGSGA